MAREPPGNEIPAPVLPDYAIRTLRLLTNAQVMGQSVVVLSDALALYDRWMEDPRVEFATEPRLLESFFRDATKPFATKAASKALMDAYLAGFANAARATLVTFDMALVRIAEHRGIPALLLS
jgi:predicted nucleic acid-binding protein